MNGKLAERYSDKQIKGLGDNEKVFAYANINCELKLRARGKVYGFDRESVLNDLILETFDH